jgi:RNA polymerase sigma-70 factor, ECF subfamily
MTEFTDIEAHRPALTGHCYRMLGSAFDADDAVREPLIARGAAGTSSPVERQ